MKGAVFHPLAEQELLDAATYYAQEQPGLEIEYLDEVERAINLLIRHPEAGSKIYNSVRRLISSRFPYSLFYRILENRQIRILAIAHHKRNPQYWIKRE
jgi:toxin ParE1/3/4